MYTLKMLRHLASRRCIQSTNIHFSSYKPERMEEKPNILSESSTTTLDNVTNINLLPYDYVKYSTSNKILVTLLHDACNYWLKIPQDKLEAVREVTDYIMQSYILLDDVQDGTLHRRNLPATNRVYGTPLTINSAVYCLLEGLKRLNSFVNPKALEVVCDHCIRVSNGTALDLYWRDNYICPTKEEYKIMVTNKIASGFVAIVGMIQTFSQDQRNYDDLMKNLGLYYTIRDEYTNLVKVEALEEKSRRGDFKDLPKVMHCEDITEGRFTWTMIHALQTSEAPTIRSILVQRTKDSTIKQYCLSLLEKVGSLDYTRQTLHDMDADLREQVRQLGGNPIMIAFLDELSNWKDV